MTDEPTDDIATLESRAVYAGSRWPDHCDRRLATWSAAATSIFAALLLLAILPTIEYPVAKKIFLIPAGRLPVTLVAIGVAGSFWADVVWTDRFDGIISFVKLLFIPLLLYQSGRSDHGRQVLIGFVMSCVLLLVCSWALFVWPDMPWPAYVKTRGIPVKDYISQSAMFTICIFTILQVAYDLWQNRHYRLAMACVGLAVLTDMRPQRASVWNFGANRLAL